MSVETGISQAVLAHQDADDTLTLVDAVCERTERDAKAQEWTTTHELLAQILEHLSLIRIEAWLIARVPRYKLPAVYHVPRPGEQEAKPRVITPSELARMTLAS